MADDNDVGLDRRKTSRFLLNFVTLKVFRLERMAKWESVGTRE